MKCLNETAYCTHTFKRFKRLREECEDLDDNPRSGWPLAAQNQATTARVHAIVTRDHQMTLKSMEGQLLVNQDKISHILPELRETGKSS
jgi:hypothetical protein